MFFQVIKILFNLDLKITQFECFKMPALNPKEIEQFIWEQYINKQLRFCEPLFEVQQIVNGGGGGEIINLLNSY